MTSILLKISKISKPWLGNVFEPPRSDKNYENYEIRGQFSSGFNRWFSNMVNNIYSNSVISRLLKLEHFFVTEKLITITKNLVKKPNNREYTSVTISKPKSTVNLVFSETPSLTSLRFFLHHYWKNRNYSKFKRDNFSSSMSLSSLEMIWELLGKGFDPKSQLKETKIYEKKCIVNTDSEFLYEIQFSCLYLNILHIILYSDNNPLIHQHQSKLNTH